MEHEQAWWEGVVWVRMSYVCVFSKQYFCLPLILRCTFCLAFLFSIERQHFLGDAIIWSSHVVFFPFHV